MIIKLNFSKKSLVLASLGRSVVSFWIQFTVVLLLFAYYSIAPHPYILFTPILVLPILLFTLGLGFMLSLMNAVVRDIGTAFPVVMTFFMFLTPVLYAKPETGPIAAITEVNPLYYMVSVPRDLILTGTTQNLQPFLICAALSAAIFVVSVVVFHLTETRIAERI